MPFHFVEEVLLIVHDHLAGGGCRFTEPLGRGDEHLVLSIPLRPGIVRNHNLVDEFQCSPVKGLPDRQACLDKNLGPLEAEW